MSFLTAPGLCRAVLFNRILVRLSPRFHQKFLLIFHNGFTTTPPIRPNWRNLLSAQCDDVDLILITSDIVAHLNALNTAIFQLSNWQMDTFTAYVQWRVYDTYSNVNRGKKFCVLCHRKNERRLKTKCLFSDDTHATSKKRCRKTVSGFQMKRRDRSRAK